MTTKIDRDTSDAHHRALLRSTTLVDGGRMEIDRDELRRLCEAATPGPWRNPYESIVSIPDGGFSLHRSPNSEKNAAFIASARTAIPALLDALEAAEARIVVLETELRGARNDLSWAISPGQNGF